MKFKWFDRSIQLKFGPNFPKFPKFVHFGGLRNFLAFESQNLARSQCSKSNKCFNRVGRCNRECSKLGLNLSCSNGSLEMDSLNPTQEFNLNQATLTKRGWGGLSKCSQGSQDVLKYSSISTHEWVKSWGINTPSHKTSRCPVSVRPARPVRPVCFEN